MNNFTITPATRLEISGDADYRLKAETTVSQIIVAKDKITHQQARYGCMYVTQNWSGLTIILVWGISEVALGTIKEELEFMKILNKAQLKIYEFKNNEDS